MLGFFKSRDRRTPVPEAPAPQDASRDSSSDPTDDEALEAAALAAGEDADAAIDGSWRARAAAVIPGGASTGSKRPAALYGAAAAFGPTHFVRARGCEVETPGSVTLIDCTMALGAVALGYGDEGVRDAVLRAVAAGNACGLSSVLEVEVAERLCDVIPCAERVRFLKTGAEATAAAVRIARAATGRAHVVASGYFGWLDWNSDGPGVPAGVRDDCTAVPFGDVEALRAAAERAGSALAAIVVEPVVERLPPAEWMAEARALCDRLGAVLVFDEVKTGFRLATGGWQATPGAVVPDLATFGKAMANGFPLAAVVGRAGVMDDGCGRAWISSTLASESGALAAASAVLDRHEAGDVAADLAAIGAATRRGVSAAIASAGLDGVRVEGLDAMWLLRWDEPAREAAFLERALAHGVLFKRGAYNYAALSHEDAVVDIEAAASGACVDLVEAAAHDDGEDA